MINPSNGTLRALLRPARGIDASRASTRLVRRIVDALLGVLVHGTVLAATGTDDALQPTPDVPLAAEFQSEVAPRLAIPETERSGYAVRLQKALDSAKVTLASTQYVVLVDRNPKVQAALVYWGPVNGGWKLVGATPVSTGRPGRYEHFTTPLGVFDHTPANPDFRALGTKNELGFRGYGVKGMRIYDFGWVPAPRGWGNGAMGVLRFQMHATDPVLAAPLFGTPRSEGCVRIPAPLNAFIDHHGLIDAAYDQATDDGANPRVLAADRAPTLSPGRYLVVVDSQRETRPDWSPSPAKH